MVECFSDRPAASPHQLYVFGWHRLAFASVAIAPEQWRAVAEALDDAMRIDPDPRVVFAEATARTEVGSLSHHFLHLIVNTIWGVS